MRSFQADDRARSHAPHQNHKALRLKSLRRVCWTCPPRRASTRKYMQGTTMTRLRDRMATIGVACLLSFLSPEIMADQGTRHIAVDVKGPSAPFNRFYNLSVGSDYPGTLLRDDSL